MVAVCRFKYRHFIIAAIFIVIGVYPFFYGEFRFFSFLLISLAIGNLLQLDLARKLAIVLYVVSMIMVVFVFFPPFTWNDSYPFNDYKFWQRFLIMVFFEIWVVIQMLLLCHPYRGAKFRKESMR